MQKQEKLGTNQEDMLELSAADLEQVVGGNDGYRGDNGWHRHIDYPRWYWNWRRHHDNRHYRGPDWNYYNR